MSFFKKFNLLIFLSAALFLHGCATAPRVSPQYTAPGAGGTYYTVPRGQTLYRLAKMYSVEVSELMRANNISNPSQVPTGTRLFIPGKAVAPPVIISKSYEPLNMEQVRNIVGPKKYSYPWKTITVHHSGTAQGSAKSFDKDHRRRRMGGLFYHFVIGNGSHTPQGSMEVGFRWHDQIKANRPYDIQICLVGNFDRQQISEGQFNSLVNLIKVLQDEYGISASKIRQHKDVPGKHTDCPGKYFPFSRLISRVSSK